MNKILKIALSIALIGTFSFAKVYEDGEDGKTDGWQALGSGSISNIEDGGNRVIQLSGERRNEAFLLGGTHKFLNNSHKWDAREGNTLSWRMKFEKKPEIYVAIQPTHQSDKIRYIKYVSSSDSDESGWNRSGSILTIKVSEKFEGEEWVTIQRDVEQDLQSYQHPYDPTKNSLIAINGVIVVGLGMMDDIKIMDEVVIPVENLNPTANAGEDQIATINRAITLAGTARDSDGSVVSYEWREGGNVLANTASFDYTPTTVGEHNLTLVVSDDDGAKGSDEIIITVQEPVAIEQGSLRGKVVNISGNAISNATIQIGNQQTSSDANGNFSISDINVSNRVIINISKRDYINNSRIVQIQKDMETSLAVTLAQRSSNSFNTSEGATVEGDGGGALSLPANSYLNADGTPYSGSANLSLNYYPISTPQGQAMFPGNFDAINSANQQGTLRSYGFITMSLQDSSGNPLDISGGANISIPADLSLGVPPATIPLWYYDEDRGIWVEDGVATYDEATRSYRGAITRIAVYNLDVFMSSGNLKICVEDTEGNKLSNAYVRIESPSTNWFGQVGPTNNTGYMKILMVMGNTNLNLSAYLSDGRYGIYGDNPVTVTPNVDNVLPSCIVVADGNSTLTGVIQEQGSGTKLSAVKVTLRSGGVYLRTTQTDSNGAYGFDHLIGGLVYDLEYTKVGYNSKEQEDVTLLDDEEKDLALVGMVPIVIPNQPPVANAGEDKSVTVNQTITLVGTGTDSDGSIVAYEWREGAIVLANTASFDYTPDSVGEHNLTLTVTDDDGAVGSDGMSVSAMAMTNISPVAHAGVNKTITLGTSVDLDGTASIDSDGTISSYEWKEGSTVLSNSSSFSKSDFTIGTHVITLTVTDDDGATNTNRVTIIVNPLPDTTIPVITRIGNAEVNITKGSAYTDAGATASDNVDGDLTTSIVTYNHVDISVVGSYMVTYNVKDSSNNQAVQVTRKVNILDIVTPNQAPVVNAGTNKIATVNTSITITGTATDDGKISGYEWREGANVLATTASFNHTFTTLGEHNLTLFVTDDDGAVGSDSLKVNVVNVITASGKLKKTGQTKSYDQAGNIVTNGSVKDDGYYQKGLTPSYTRDDTKEIVTDNVTQLQWQDNSDAKTVRQDWESAKYYCSILTLGDYHNWRLPTRKELFGIVDFGRNYPPIDISKFKNISSGSHYWSATTYANISNRMWFVNFDSGYVYYRHKSVNLYVRCVRAGE